MIQVLRPLFRALSTGLATLRRRTGEIPFTAQNSSSECGLACLTMVLNHLGRPTSLDEVRGLVATDREGVSARQILEAGQLFGLRGHGVAGEVDDLAFLNRGTILHWDLNHFVVLETVTSKGIVIVDPATGRRTVPLDEVRRSFSGVALCFERADALAPAIRRKSPWAILQRLVALSKTLAKLLVVTLILQAVGLALPVFITLLVDRVVPRAEHDLLRLMAVGVAILILFNFLSGLVRDYLLVYLRVRLNLGLKLEFLAKLLKLPYSFFLTRPTGDLLERLASGGLVMQALSASAVSSLLDGLWVLAYLTALLAVSASTGALVFGLGVVQVLLLAASIRRRNRLLDSEAHLSARSSAVATEMIYGIETVKGLGLEDRFLGRWVGRFTELLNAEIHRSRLEAGYDGVTRAVQFGSPLVVLLYGANKVLNGELSLGAMLGFFALAVGFFNPLSNLLFTVVSLVHVRAHLVRLHDVFEAVEEQAGPSRRLPPALKGGVELDHVTFRYGPLGLPVIRDVSLWVEPGQFVALVGRSGSGKTTLARLLIGLLSPSEGEIRMDGVSIREYQLGPLRGQLGIVTQRPYLFNQTILSNVTASDPTATLDDAIQAAQLACIHDEVAQIPSGYAMLVAEGGASLSGGQVQRLALARALLRRPRILVLDEATSALDAATEKAVHENLERLRCTRIVIAHRLSTIRHADVIVVLEEGRIVEQGRHEELLAKGQAYARLVAAQLDSDRR